MRGCVYICTCVCILVYARVPACVVSVVGADAPTAVRYYSGFFVVVSAHNALLLCALHPPKGYRFPCVSLCVSLAVLVASVAACANPARSAVLTAPPAPTGEPRHHPRRARSRLHLLEAPLSAPPRGGSVSAASSSSRHTRPRFSRPSFATPVVTLPACGQSVRAPFAAGSGCPRPAPACASAGRLHPHPAAPPARPACFEWLFPNQSNDCERANVCE